MLLRPGHHEGMAADAAQQVPTEPIVAQVASNSAQHRPPIGVPGQPGSPQGQSCQCCPHPGNCSEPGLQLSQVVEQRGTEQGGTVHP